MWSIGSEGRTAVKSCWATMLLDFLSLKTMRTVKRGAGGRHQSTTMKVGLWSTRTETAAATTTTRNNQQHAERRTKTVAPTQKNKKAISMNKNLPTPLGSSGVWDPCLSPCPSCCPPRGDSKTPFRFQPRLGSQLTSRWAGCLQKSLTRPLK